MRFFQQTLVLQCLFITFGTLPLLQAQDMPTHRLHSELFGSSQSLSELEWDSLNVLRGIAPSFQTPFFIGKRTDECELDRIVFGWHPYWMGTSYENYDYSLLSDLSYFSYEVNPNTGNYNTIHSWKTTNLVPIAKAAGRRVNLCVTLFSNHATFFNNPDAKRTLIDSLIALVKLRDADGVNIDFESISGSQRDNLTAFMKQLGERFHSELPGSQISIDLPAVDWQKTFDVKGMEPYVDLFIIMGYAYHWSGSQGTGPNAPKNNGALWGPYDLTRSINYYLNLDLSSKKLCLGLPWYGQDWPAASAEPNAATQGRGTARLYSRVRDKLDERERQWDRHSSTPWYAYNDGNSNWRQTWYDDEISLSMKYDLAIMKDLAGIAIWALGYDGGYQEMWDALQGRFASCGATSCTGEITDMGGPTGSYPANDNWSYTIAPEGATSVTLNFDEFDIADDQLLLYDGPDTQAPLLAELTGSSPGNPIVAKNGKMTLHFLSNGERQGTGFIGKWNCTTMPLSLDEGKDPPFSVTLFPNPTNKHSILQLTLPSLSGVTITLYNLLGIKIDNIQRSLFAGEHIIELNQILDRKPSGIYILEISTGSGHLWEKVIIP